MKSIITSILFSVCITISVLSQNVLVVVIDGARYSETFGDPNFTYSPYMAELAKSGTYLSRMYNQHQTYTSRAIPALWTGGWAGVYAVNYQGQENQATYSPTIFEYFRKQKNAEATSCFYMIKYVSSLWLQSFHADYGPDYWPQTVCNGVTDNDVLANSLEVIETKHPQFLWVYLADVDHAGHSANWQAYTSSLLNADNIVNTLWASLQENEFYKDKTTMIVTNDHGRHDDNHGGFTGHGCSCEGCRQIMFLAIGPNIKENYISTEEHEIADVAVTAAYLLDVNPEYSTGNLATEIFKTSNVSAFESDISVSYYNRIVGFELKNPERITLIVYDLHGREIETLAQNKLCSGICNFHIGNIQSGIYIIKLQLANRFITKKIFVK